MNREELQNRHRESLISFEAYLSRKKLDRENAEKIQQAKKEWEFAWTRLMETLLTLERLEI